MLPAAPSLTFGYCRDVVSAAWIVRLGSASEEAAVVALRAHLAAAGISDSGEPGGAAGLAEADVVIVWADRRLEPDLVKALADPGVRVLLAGATLAQADRDGVLSDAAGVDLGPVSPEHDVRLRMGPDGQHLYSAFHTHGDHAHHDEHEHLPGRVATVERIARRRARPAHRPPRAHRPSGADVASLDSDSGLDHGNDTRRDR